MTGVSRHLKHSKEVTALHTTLGYARITMKIQQFLNRSLVTVALRVAIAVVHLTIVQGQIVIATSVLL